MEAITDRDMKLADQIGHAVAHADKLRAAHVKAKDADMAAAKEAGDLLVAAHKLHPKTADFEKFLKLVPGGVQMSRAYELMAVAGGSKTVEQLRADTRQRVKDHRAKKKKLADATKALPDHSVTVTESTTDNVVPLKLPPPSPKAAKDPGLVSLSALKNFKAVCDACLPLLTVADMIVASEYFISIFNARKVAHKNRKAKR